MRKLAGSEYVEESADAGNDKIGMLDEELDPLFNVKECLDER